MVGQDIFKRWCGLRAKDVILKERKCIEIASKNINRVFMWSLCHLNIYTPTNT